MTIKKIGLSTLLFSAVLLTAGAATQVQAHAATGDSTTPTTKITADSSDTATHGVMPGTTYAVWTTMPDRAGYNNVITLTADENTTYPIFDPQGVSLEEVLNGQTSYSVDQLQLSLQPRNPNDSKDYNTAGLFARTSTSEWVKVAGPGVKDIGLDAGNSTLTNNDGGLNPTNLVINFTDQNGKDAQAPLVLPISTPQPGDQPSVLGSDMTDMVHTLQADLTQAHYDIPGYTLRDNDSVTSDGFTTTIHYIKNADPVKPGGGGNSSSNSSSTNTSSSSSSASESSTADKPATQPVAVKGEAVYATKAIGLYQTPNFTKTTDKLRGYITANKAYVESTYYQSTPKRIKVVSRHGLNAYKTASLTGKSQRHYTRGTVLKVKAVKSYHLANRFVLPNGHYVSANKVLVIKK